MRISNSGEQPNSLRGSTKGWMNNPIYKWEVVHLVSLCLLRSLRGSLRAEIRDDTIRTSFNELTPNDHERRLVKERDRDGWRFWIYPSTYLPRLTLFQIKYILDQLFPDCSEHSTDFKIHAVSVSQYNTHHLHIVRYNPMKLFRGKMQVNRQKSICEKAIACFLSVQRGHLWQLVERDCRKILRLYPLKRY